MGSTGCDPTMVTSNDRGKMTKAKNNTFRRHLSTSTEPHTANNNEAMDDEYGDMTSDGETYVHPTAFQLENGDMLEQATLVYQTYGTLNETRDNVIVVCHALTGNASLHSWWGELLGPGLSFDTSKYFIVSANILGSCYGSTSPMSPNPASSTQPQQPYLNLFPDISVRDTVRLQLQMLQNDLGVRSVKSVIGGSFGGMQALEYAVISGSDGEDCEFFELDNNKKKEQPFLRSVIPIACGAAHTAWQIAISETQRQAIYADPKWNGGDIDVNDPPLSGLAVARQIGMVSYRTASGYEKKFGRTIKDDDDSSAVAYGRNAKWQVKSYLAYQGKKFLSRFDPVTYVKLTEQMDSHDVGRNRGGKASALAKVTVPSLVLGITSDVLYPLNEQQELAELLPNVEFGVIKSDAGHDGFLLEQEQVGKYITNFLNKLD